MNPINYYAVLVCGVASFVLGMLWYGPLFGKIWIKLMGFTEKHMDEEKKKCMSTKFVLAFIGSLVLAYVTANLFVYTSVVDLQKGLIMAVWLWLGFIATTTLSSVLWEGRSWKLYFLNNAYSLVQLLIFAAILVSWK